MWFLYPREYQVIGDNSASGMREIWYGENHHNQNVLAYFGWATSKEYTHGSS
jgi:hypothetical protein